MKNTFLILTMLGFNVTQAHATAPMATAKAAIIRASEVFSVFYSMEDVTNQYKHSTEVDTSCTNCNVFKINATATAYVIIKTFQVGSEGQIVAEQVALDAASMATNEPETAIEAATAVLERFGKELKTFKLMKVVTGNFSSVCSGKKECSLFMITTASDDVFVRTIGAAKNSISIDVL